MKKASGTRLNFLMNSGKVIPMQNQNQMGKAKRDASFSKANNRDALVNKAKRLIQVLFFKVTMKNGRGEMKANSELWKKSAGKKKGAAQRK